MKMPSAACGSLTFALLACACTPTRPHAAQLQQFERQIEQIQAQMKVPGISAAIVQDQKVIWSKGFGFADVERRVPATPETLYHLASVTKPVAATLVMQLVEQGKLDLDEPASKYSPDFKDDTVKLKHLITHTSAGTPGDKFQYDGNRYDYLTQVLEKQTGKPIRTLLAEAVLDPLRMTGSVPSQDSVDPANGFDAPHRARYASNLQRFAKGYSVYGAESVEVPYPPPNVGAAAGLLSTVLDIARFDAAIDRHELIRQQTQDRAWTRYTSNSGAPVPYGLGWFVQDYHGEQLIWHSGNWGRAFSANYVKVPAKGLTLIILGNSEALSDPFSQTDEAFTDITHYAFSCAFLSTFVAAHDCAAARQHATDWLDKRRATARKAIPIDPQAYAAYLGRYELRKDRIFTVTREGNELIINFDRGEVAGLYPEAPDQFFTKFWDIFVTFGRDAKGKVTHLDLVIGEGNESRRAKKIP